MSNKEKYRKFCDDGNQPHLFLNDWWLDAVAGSNNWDVAIIEKGNEIFGALPYLHKNKFGLSLISSPKFTQHLGVWIKYPEGQQYFKKLSFEKEIFQALIDQLPKFNYALLKCHYSITNGLPFSWNGFELSNKYTYIIDDLSNIDKLYDGLSSGTKKNLKKAESLVHFEESNDINHIFDLNQMTFDRQGETLPYSIEELKRLDVACVEKKCRKILIAKDDQQHVHAALYLVWNEESAYYLIGGGNPKYRNSEALTLLMWEAIKFSSTVSKTFDFEGSMLEPIERFFRGFGSTQTPYFELKKYNSKMLKALMSLT